ncbi:MAG: geranylgeranylglyceryl/heptaprenylglyceryl phosphate synthase, partial [Bacteroidota bacterium]
MPHDFLPQLIARKAAGKKSLAILIDPDKAHPDGMLDLLQLANQHGVDAFLVGGSLLKDDFIQQLVPLMKANTDIPVILFPGGVQQIVPTADGILFLSLISGRNPDLLIGQQVLAAPLL